MPGTGQAPLWEQGGGEGAGLGPWEPPTGRLPGGKAAEALGGLLWSPRRPSPPQDHDLSRMLTPSHAQAAAAVTHSALGGSPPTSQLGNSPNIPASRVSGTSRSRCCRGSAGRYFHAKPQNLGSDGLDQLKVRE